MIFKIRDLQVKTFRIMYHILIYLNQYMIHYSKGLDLEITDFEYHHDPTYTGETKPLK